MKIWTWGILNHGLGQLIIGQLTAAILLWPSCHRTTHLHITIVNVHLLSSILSLNKSSSIHHWNPLIVQYVNGQHWKVVRLHWYDIALCEVGDGLFENIVFISVIETISDLPSTSFCSVVADLHLYMSYYKVCFQLL